MKPDRVAAWLAFTMYVSAARADANPRQLDDMRKHVVPAIEGLKRRDLTTEEVRRLLGVILARVQTIMGKDWRPQGEWMVVIEYMLGEVGVRTGNTGPVSGVSRERASIRKEAARRRSRSRRGRHALPPDGADG